MVNLTLKQADRKGTKEEPFVDDNVEILITGLPTGDEHPGNSYWMYSLKTASGRSAMDRIGPHYLASEKWALDSPDYGPSILTIWNFQDRYGDELLELTITSHMGTAQEQKVSAYLIDAKYVSDAPSPPPTNDPIEDDPADRSVRISAAGERVQISKGQRDLAVEAGDLILINPGTMIAEYVTELSTEQFIAKYPFPDVPDEEPSFLSFPDPILDPVLDEPFRRIDQGTEESLVFDLHAGGQLRQLFVDGEQIVWQDNTGAAIQGDISPGHLYAHGGQTGKWKDDPLKSKLAPTQGGNTAMLRHVPITYKLEGNKFACLTQMVDFWAWPQTTKYLTKFYQDWTVELIESQILLDASFYHLYATPTYIESYRLWFFPLARHLQSMTRPHGGGISIETGYLELVRTADQRFLLVADEGGPYLGAWLTGEIGEPGPEGIQEVYQGPKPIDAYTAVTGKLWDVNRLVDPGEKLNGRMVISLDGDIVKARMVLDGYVPEREGYTMHEKQNAIVASLARHLIETNCGRKTPLDAVKMAELQKQELEDPSIDEL
jgi:hypothetical protein